jgi:hypothetical protein
MLLSEVLQALGRWNLGLIAEKAYLALARRESHPFRHNLPVDLLAKQPSC